jgi:hypothetical protein
MKNMLDYVFSEVVFNTFCGSIYSRVEKSLPPVFQVGLRMNMMSRGNEICTQIGHSAS